MGTPDVIGAQIGAATGGSGGGGGGGGSKKKARKQANQLFQMTQPLRESFVDEFSNLMSGEFDPSASPIFRTGKDITEQQFDVARQNVLGTTPRGGQLVDALTGLEADRATALGGIGADITQDQMNKAFSFATGAPAITIPSMANLAGQQAQAQAIEQAGKYQALGQTAGGAGFMLGSK